DAKKPILAALRTGSTDQLKVFLDSTEVFALDTRRSASLDQDAIPLSLREGKSTLLIKTSWTGSIGRLMFRVTAPDGGPLADVSVKADRASIEEALARAKKPPSKEKRTVAAVTDAVDRAVQNAKGRDLAEALSVRADLSAVLSLFDRRKLPTQPEQDLERAIA